MERIFIAHYQPKYNVQFVKEGVQSIVSPEQLDSVEWSLLSDYPNGFPYVSPLKCCVGFTSKHTQVDISKKRNSK